jgi:hypothetical protein
MARPDEDRMLKRLVALTSASSAKGVEAPAASKRRRKERDGDRQSMFRIATAEIGGGAEARCIVKDLGRNGARIAFDGSPSLPPVLVLRMDSTGEKRLARVVWQHEREAGLLFDPSLAGDAG